MYQNADFERLKKGVQHALDNNNQKAVDKAGQITSSIKGVKSVKNDLIVK
jgi:hypothetical protein